MNNTSLQIAEPQQSGFNIFQELKSQYEILSDKSNSIDDRLDAFENISECEIGDTPLLRGRNIEREIGISQVFLKFEGGNPTGTQKDRIAFAQCMDALRRGYEGITLATCGNYGVACSLAASAAGLRCVIFIPESYHAKRVGDMEKLGSEVRRIPGDYENAVAISQTCAQVEELYDANPGGDNTPIQLKAYGEIAYEIYDELRDAPKIVASPVSNGTMLSGIYKGFQSLYRRGKTSRMPLIVAGSSAGKNPIVESYLKQKKSCEDLDPDKIKESLINEPLINWHSFDGDITLQAILKTGGWASNVTDKTLLAFTKILKEKEGLNILPASAAGLAALAEAPDPTQIQNDRFVVILTGRRA